MNDPGLELDHVVIFSAVDAPEARALEALGLLGFGGVTRHEGLGTASTSFFVRDHYLELLWAYDDARAGEVFGPLGLDVPGRRRWRETGLSPFGIMLRRTGAAGPLPFETRPLRLGQATVDFAVAAGAEPYVGLVPPELSYPGFRHHIAQPSHPLGVKDLTGAQITVSVESLSPTAEWLARSGLVALQRGPEPLLTLSFDEGAQGKTVDVRPVLPLVLRG